MTSEPFPTRADLARLLPEYRLIRQLSQSAMSSVYLAEEIALGRRVALKVLGPELAAQPNFRERFKREVWLAAKLDHPNIIPVHAAGESAELCYLTMRYVDGPDLRTILRDQGPLETERALRIVGQVAAALDAAHESGLIHRDVKPGNVLVDPRSGHAYLCDFGIAKSVSAETFTPDGQFAGTPDYTAPEQIQGARVDHRADVYALGCVIYQCLTGSKPFPRTETAAVLWAHLQDPPPRVTAARPELPAAVDAVVARAMAKQPGDRHATCTQLVAELAAAASGAVAPHQPPPRPGSGRRGRTRLVAALVAAGLAIAAGVFIVRPWSDGSGGALAADRLARVPEPLRADCRVADTPAVAGAEATLSCRTADGHEAVVSLFADQGSVDGTYEQAVRESGIANGSGDCATATGAEHRYPSVGAPRGRVLCHARNGMAIVVWTDNRARVVARAGSGSDDDRALVGSWASWVSSPAFPAPEEQALIDLVGETDCGRAGAGSLDDFGNVVAAVECTPSDAGARTVSYYRFTEQADLQRTFDGHVAEAKAPTGVYCAEGTAPGFLGNRRYDLRSVEIGGLLCHPGPQSTLVMEWSVEPLRVLGRAIGTDPEDLSGWWSRNYGPPTSKIVEAVNAQADPPFPSDQEKALLDHIPEQSRTNCIRPSKEQVKINVSKPPVVGVVCGPTSGARIVFYYQFPDPAAMNANYEVGGRPQGPDCTTLPTNFTGEAAYANTGSGGRLLCATNDAGFRYMTWTNDRLAIQTFAFQGGEPIAMIDWWRHDAGPV